MVPHYTLYSTQYCEILNSEVGMVWIDTLMAWDGKLVPNPTVLGPEESW